MASSSQKARTQGQQSTLHKQALFYFSVLIVFLGASCAPTPLYPLYQHAWGFSSAVLTTVFAVYMFALLATLLVSGSLSDHWGRKPVIGGAIVLEALAFGAFLLANGPGWLIVGRVLQGVATGIMTSAVVAAIIDSDARRGALMASIGPFFGMAVGGLFSGLLVSYAPLPMRLVFVLLLGGLLLQLAWLPAMVETALVAPGHRLSLRPQVKIPTSVRATLLRVVAVSIAAWMLGGFTLSLGPSLVLAEGGLQTPLMGVLPLFALSLVGSGVIFILRQHSPQAALWSGGWGITIGMGLILLGLHQHMLWLLLVAILVAGAGFGGGFMGVMRAVTPLVAASERSAVMAALYIIWYMAASMPALIAGIATDYFGLEATTYVYGAVVMGLAMVALLGIFNNARESQPTPCPNG
ncbi:MFS transporter [Salinisphaera orenii]|uniref:MFS transporter n=1 Tax=Salinisphaera orenii TaxID=856731 RepID=UPI0013A60B11